MFIRDQEIHAQLTAFLQQKRGNHILRVNKKVCGLHHFLVAMYDNTSFFFPVSLYQKFQFKKSCHFRRLKFLNKESEICFSYYYTHIKIERAWPCINIQILLEAFVEPVQKIQLM